MVNEQINMQLAKPDERKKIENVVQALVSFGLKMIQQKNEDGIYSYRLEP